VPHVSDGPTGLARQPDDYLPWTRRQVRTADSWPTHRDEPVSVALSPDGDRLALTVGQRIKILDISDDPGTAQQLKQSCAPTPGLAWSPGGEKLAFRDDNGQGRVIDLSGDASSQEAERQMAALGPASAVAFIPDSDRLAVVAASLPGRMTLTVIGPNRVAIWEQALTGKRMSSSHPEGVNLAVSPDGHLLACATGTSRVWVFETATGRLVGEFNEHSKTVTGLSWIDDEWLLSASTDATLRAWRPNDPVSTTVVETIAAAGLAFVRERRTALIWSARGQLVAWSLAETPAQLWERNPSARSVGAYLARPAVSAVAGMLALVDAGSTELLLVKGWDRVDSAPPEQTGEPAAVGPFRLVSELGADAMGKTYLGRSAGGRLVALKIVRPELAGDPEFRERLAREIAAAKEVSGLFTVPVVAADVDGPQPWLATAYMAGPSLARVVAENGPLPVESVRKLASGLAEGLGQIHAAGLVHRDLKPSNVLLLDDGPRILDFGIARIASGRELGEAGMVIGNAGYMSPEQALGRPVDPASDVFSLGAVLFYAATGENPFGDGPFASQLHRLVSEPPRLDRVPVPIRPLIRSALAKEPHDRPSLAQLLSEFEHSDLRPDERLVGAAGETGQWEPPEDDPYIARPEEGPGLGESAGMSTQARLQPDSSSGPPPGAGRVPTRHRRGKRGHGPASPAKISREAASSDREQGSRLPSRSTGQLRKLAAQILGWLIPPREMAALQADHQTQQEEALRHIEAEIDRAYSALGLPPGLEGSVRGGRFDVERD